MGTPPDRQGVVEIRWSQMAKEDSRPRVWLLGRFFPVRENVVAGLGFVGAKLVSDDVSERRVKIGQRDNRAVKFSTLEYCRPRNKEGNPNAALPEFCFLAT